MDNRSLNSGVSLCEELGKLHEAVHRTHPAVGRMAVATHDPDNHRLRTFIHSTAGRNPLPLYEVRKDTVPSLTRLAKSGRPRVVNDIRNLPRPHGDHTRRLLDGGFRSSLTVPLFEGEGLLGFLFLDATETGYFSPGRVRSLDVPTQTAGLLVRHHLAVIRMLRAAVDMMRELSRARDWETGNHVRRMARYARLIAARLGAEWNLDDEWVEFLFLFAPLHDVGKISVPDRVLLKEGALDAEERRVMRTHPEAGVRIIDTLLADAELADLPQGAMLRNIVRYHHEATNGSGYPEGLAGDRIPPEARMTAVADVFDALTTRRPYKDPWSVERAFDFLSLRSGELFDSRCVEALVSSGEEVEEAMERFRDTHLLPISEEDHFDSAPV